MSSKNKTKDTKQAATPATTDDLDALVSSVVDLIAPLQALHQQAVNAYRERWDSDAAQTQTGQQNP